ncbi:MAG TPA: DUF1902 domain-containing protein [Steroidobacteraceae bacterium]|jgi:hypothetical protein
MNFKIDVHWDDEARVWYVEDSNVPGLAAEASTVEAMQALLRVRVPELLELNMPQLFESRQSRSSYEIVTHRRQDVAVAC